MVPPGTLGVVVFFWVELLLFRLYNAIYGRADCFWMLIFECFCSTLEFGIFEAGEAPFCAWLKFNEQRDSKVPSLSQRRSIP